MEEKNIRQILLRYLLGDATEKEINVVDHWYNSLEGDGRSASPEDALSDVGIEIWERIVPVVEPPRRWWIGSNAARVAAMVVLLVLTAGVILLFKHNARRQDSLAFTTISTGVGERKAITIQDGSRLILDAGTTIRVGSDFSRERVVEVEDGEIFLNVSKDEARPFLIRSAGLTTRVLGTSFTVSAYRELNNISIGVVSGKVSVASGSKSMGVLEKDQELVYNKLSNSYKMGVLDESLTAWQNGRLVLNDLSFDEMVVVVRKNFGIEVGSGDSAVRSTRYTTELVSSMTPKEAVEVLAAIHRLRIARDGNKIVFYR